jgi:hypothetical protein
MIQHAQKDADMAAGRYRVSIDRRTPGSYCGWFTTNPQGGGFGTNTSSPSLRRAEAQAIRNVPPGATYRLIVNGEDRGTKTVEGTS